MLIAYVNDTTLFASVPPLHIRYFIAESLNRESAKINGWCKLGGMKMDPTKTHFMTVSRSTTAFSPHPYLSIDDMPLTA